MVVILFYLKLQKFFHSWMFINVFSIEDGTTYTHFQIIETFIKLDYIKYLMVIVYSTMSNVFNVTTFEWYEYFWN